MFLSCPETLMQCDLHVCTEPETKQALLSFITFFMCKHCFYDLCPLVDSHNQSLVLQYGHLLTVLSLQHVINLMAT